MVSVVTLLFRPLGLRWHPCQLRPIGKLVVAPPVAPPRLAPSGRRRSFLLPPIIPDVYVLPLCLVAANGSRPSSAATPARYNSLVGSETQNPPVGPPALRSGVRNLKPKTAGQPVLTALFYPNRGSARSSQWGPGPPTVVARQRPVPGQGARYAGTFKPFGRCRPRLKRWSLLSEPPAKS